MASNIVFRYILRNKYIWINILGLSIGLSIFMTIFLYIQNELSFEKGHRNLSDIYRIEQFKQDGDEIRQLCGTPPPLSLTIAEEIPGIRESTRFVKDNTSLVRLEDGTKQEVKDIIYADASFLNIFTFPVLFGPSDGRLQDPYMAVITRESARKLFGVDNPIGKKIQIDNSFDVEIKSVVEKVQGNSHLDFSILISFETLHSVYGSESVTEDWFSNWVHHYILLNRNESAQTINSSIRGYLKKYQGEESKNILYLKPLKDIHLKSNVIDEYAEVGNMQDIIIFSIIGILILVIASVNYINLTTAYSVKRSKEVGIRKIIGASRQNLILQFLKESGIILLISMVVAVILMEFILPYFNNLINRHLNIDYVDNPKFIIVFFLISMITGLVSGAFPAFMISAFNPITTLRGKFTGGRKGSIILRKGLVVFQFFISITLIISTLIIIRQISFLKNKDLGFDKDQVLIIELTSPSSQQFNQFKNELEKLSGIKKVACSDYLPMNSTNWTGFVWEGAPENEYIKMNINYVGPSFLSVYDMKLSSGRYFTPEMANREEMYVLLNESAVKKIGWGNEAIGKHIMWSVDYRNRDEKTAVVAGVVKDFHFLSKHQPINPIIMPLLNLDASGSQISIKYSSADISSLISSIQQIFYEIYSEEGFNYHFADAEIDNIYREEGNLGNLISFLTFIAILIAMMGLFGLTTFSASQRIKEIGIRKVNGASFFQIIKLLSRDFIKLMAIAFILSCPAAWISMNIWFRNFSYKATIGWWVYITGGLIALAIVAITVSYQSIKVAIKNPAESLRYE